jgi:hypothetical protein
MTTYRFQTADKIERWGIMAVGPLTGVGLRTGCLPKKTKQPCDYA